MKKIALSVCLALFCLQAFSQKKYAIFISPFSNESEEKKISARANFVTMREALAAQGFMEMNISIDTSSTTKDQFFRSFSAIEKKFSGDDLMLVYLALPVRAKDKKTGEWEFILSPKASISSREYQAMLEKVNTKGNDHTDFITLVEGGDANISNPRKEGLGTSFIYIFSRSENVALIKDKTIAITESGVLANAFSNSITHISKNDYTYRSLFDEMKKYIRVHTPTVIPQFLGKGLDRVFFGGRYLVKRPYYVITSKKSETEVIINAGQRINLLTGAKVGFYPAGIIDYQNLIPVAEGTVTNTTSFSSVVQLNKPIGLPDRYWVYIIKNGNPGATNKIKFNNTFEGDTQSTIYFNEIMASLQKTEVPQLFDMVSGGGNLKIKSIHSGYGKGLLLTLVNPVTGQFYTEINCENTKDVSPIIGYINKVARYQYLAKLNNDIADISLDFKLKYTTSDKSPLTENGYDVFFEEDRCYITFYNRTPNKIYFSMLDLQPDMVINPIYPNSRMKDKDGNPAPLWAIDCVVNPFDSLSLKSLEIGLYPPYGLEKFKLFTSREPLDMTSFLTDVEDVTPTRAKEVQTFTMNSAPLFTDINIQDYDFEIRSRLYEKGIADNEKVSLEAPNDVDDQAFYKINNPSVGRIYYNVLKRDNTGKYVLIYPEGNDKSASCFIDGKSHANVLIRDGLVRNDRIITVYADRPFSLSEFTSSDKHISDLLVEIIQDGRISGSSLNKIGMVQDLYEGGEKLTTRNNENILIEMLTPTINTERGGRIEVQAATYKINGFAYGIDKKPVTSIKINGEAVTYKPDFKYFERNISLGVGVNKIVIEAKDEKGFVATQVFELELKGNNLEGTRAARNYFLGIGIDNYKLWPALKNAKLDVKRFATLLENKFGYDSSTMKFLFDEAATRDIIMGSIHQFLKIAGPNDNIIIYMAGHGQKDPTAEGIYYFISHDAQEENLYTAVKASDITDFYKRIKAKKCLLIVDACYSGMIINSVTPSNPLITPEETKIPPEDRSCKWIITSGSATPVLDGEEGQNSPFAKEMIEYLEGRTDEKDIQITTLVKHLNDKAPEKYPKQEPMSVRIDGRGEKFFRIIPLKK